MSGTILGTKLIWPSQRPYMVRMLLPDSVDKETERPEVR